MNLLTDPRQNGAHLQTMLYESESNMGALLGDDLHFYGSRGHSITSVGGLRLRAAEVVFKSKTLSLIPDYFQVT